jgi:S1-C subfamily serine protease
VERNSCAANAGLYPGDIIVLFGGRPIRSVDDFAALIHRLPISGRIRIGIIRGNRLGYGILAF